MTQKDQSKIFAAGEELCTLLAAGSRDHERILALIAAGPVHFADTNGNTPLIHAADRNLLEYVVLLIAKGAQLEAADCDGHTALLDAARRGHEDVVRRLVMAGARLHKQDESGETALMMAARCGYDGIVKILTERGGYPALRDKDNETPLMLAARGGSLSCVKLLVVYDDGLDAVNDRGEGAFEIARRFKNHDVVAFLEDFQKKRRFERRLSRGMAVDEKVKPSRTIRFKP